MPYMKASLLEEFELPEITQEAIKQNLIKLYKKYFLIYHISPLTNYFNYTYL